MDLVTSSARPLAGEKEQEEERHDHGVCVRFADMRSCLYCILKTSPATKHVDGINCRRRRGHPLHWNASVG